ncbi:MAG: CDP-alcohol phosphatidyltransferase family protein [Candidatus Thermoplasmatota archaeon]|jgi:phosphatidylglycerophosphate synthase|nr:CDP-alcohol phosphatidyltransferase family protein [Candidatus Thermoplasmatota archaeon]MDP7264968.1 CDP-alcohol phosphatidyltransferase family protein [Candidatus Thermoplasmatota archaeon]
MVNLATKVTIGRICLIPPTIIFLLLPNYRWAACVTVTSLAVMDSLDGYIARKRGEITKLGTFLDPMADKLSLLALLITLPLVYSYFTWWLSAVLIGTGVLMVIGWGMHYYVTGNPVVIPSKMGKITMAVQYSTIGLSVLFATLYLDFNLDPFGGNRTGVELFFLGISFLCIFTTVDYFFNMVHHGLKSHPDITSPMENVKIKRDIKREMKNKPPAKRRVMGRIYEKTELRKMEPKYLPEVMEKFEKFRVCQICQGSMKKKQVARCQCGRHFHWGCLEKMQGECPRCGTVIHMGEDNKLENPSVV